MPSNLDALLPALDAALKPFNEAMAQLDRLNPTPTKPVNPATVLRGTSFASFQLAQLRSLVDAANAVSRELHNAKPDKP